MEIILDCLHDYVKLWFLIWIIFWFCFVFWLFFFESIKKALLNSWSCKLRWVSRISKKELRPVSNSNSILLSSRGVLGVISCVQDEIIVSKTENLFLKKSSKPRTKNGCLIQHYFIITLQARLFFDLLFREMDLDLPFLRLSSFFHLTIVPNLFLFPHLSQTFWVFRVDQQTPQSLEWQFQTNVLQFILQLGLHIF